MLTTWLLNSFSNSSKDTSLKTSPMIDFTASSLASKSGGGEIYRKGGGGQKRDGHIKGRIVRGCDK